MPCIRLFSCAKVFYGTNIFLEKFGQIRGYMYVRASRFSLRKLMCHHGTHMVGGLRPIFYFYFYFL